MINVDFPCNSHYKSFISPVASITQPSYVSHGLCWLLSHSMIIQAAWLYLKMRYRDFIRTMYPYQDSIPRYISNVNISSQSTKSAVRDKYTSISGEHDTFMTSHLMFDHFVHFVSKDDVSTDRRRPEPSVRVSVWWTETHWSYGLYGNFVIVSCISLGKGTKHE